jgi:solute carrier family 8 (sodium/calcium exchanger)
VVNQSETAYSIHCLSKSLVFEPGESINYIEIDIVDDDIWEEDEVFFAKISVDPSEPGVVGKRAITKVSTLLKNKKYISDRD